MTLASHMPVSANQQRQGFYQPNDQIPCCGTSCEEMYDAVPCHESDVQHEGLRASFPRASRAQVAYLVHHIRNALSNLVFHRPTIGVAFGQQSVCKATPPLPRLHRISTSKYVKGGRATIDSSWGSRGFPCAPCTAASRFSFLRVSTTLSSLGRPVEQPRFPPSHHQAKGQGT